MVPFPWCLLQAIKAFLKPTHQLILALLLKTLWLLHVYLLVKVSMEESNFHIHLDKIHVHMCCQSKNTLQSCHFNNWQEDFIKINTLLFSKTFCH